MKKCRNPECREPFENVYSSMQKTCSIPCALALVAASKDKAERKDNREFKKRHIDKDFPYWIKKLQAEFNKFIRARDKGLPCISCQRLHGGQIHAGHYKTVGGNPELRFDELNCHAQCSTCNNHLSGNLIKYRSNLLVKIGAKKLRYLEGPHKAKNYTIADLKELLAHYRALNKEQ